MLRHQSCYRYGHWCYPMQRRCVTVGIGLSVYVTKCRYYCTTNGKRKQVAVNTSTSIMSF